MFLIHSCLIINEFENLFTYLMAPYIPSFMKYAFMTSTQFSILAVFCILVLASYMLQISPLNLWHVCLTPFMVSLDEETTLIFMRLIGC